MVWPFVYFEAVGLRVHPKIVSERLGHANIRITLDTYSHLLPGLQEAAVLGFDKALEMVAVDAR